MASTSSRSPNNVNPWNTVTLTNNIIADNVAGAAAGGVSIVDALRVTAVNNTIAFNDSTATSQQAFSNAGDTLVESATGRAGVRSDQQRAAERR